MRWNDWSFVNVPMIFVLSCCWDTAKREKGKTLEESCLQNCPAREGKCLGHGCAEAELSLLWVVLSQLGLSGD